MPRLVAVALLTVACQASPSGSAPLEPTTPVLAAAGSIRPSWRFLHVTGEVEVDGRPARKDMEIGTTSTIETAAGAHALVTLGPGSIIEVRENTKLALGTSEGAAISAQLIVGQLWSLFGGAADYEVVTDNAVAGVRGSAFFVDACDDMETVVCACSHRVHLRSLDPRRPSDEEIVAGEWEHIGFTFKRRGKRIKTRKTGPMPNPSSHPDSRAEELLALMHEK